MYNILSARRSFEIIKGLTRLMLTKIPFYKEVILLSFDCSHCFYSNNEVQSGYAIQEQGIRISVKVRNARDLSRQVVKSEYAAVSVPKVQLEIPHRSQTAEITNIEGIILRTKASLEQNQDERKEKNPEYAMKIEQFLQKLESLLSLESEFSLIVDDPSGNSFIESPDPSRIDADKSVVHYHRSLEQQKMLGLVDDAAVEEEGDRAIWESRDALKNEVLELQSLCDSCAAPVEINTKVQEIPHFKEVVIMSSNCDRCSHRTVEVKTNSGIDERGVKLNLHILDKQDLTRDILKSETCSIEIPELELECGMAALAGRFTTVEGLLIATRDQLKESSMTFLGDSSDAARKQKLEDLFSRLDLAVIGELPVHLILDDPAGCSYIQSLSPPGIDERLEVTFYERSYEQNEELGLNDMKTEDYTQTDSL